MSAMSSNRAGSFLKSAVLFGAGLAFLGAITGGAIAVGVACYIPCIYRSVGKLIITPAPGGAGEGDSRFYATQAELLQGARLNNTVRSKLTTFGTSTHPLPDYSLTVELPLRSSVFRVYVDSSNAEFARVYVNTLFEEYAVLQDSLKTTPGVTPLTVNVLEPAYVFGTPVYPSRPRLVLSGIALGGVAGLIGGVLLARWRTTRTSSTGRP
jgi:uncharacterized protein involved in exopolysaccharide biosynthesis